MPLDVGPEEPTPFLGAGFGFEEETVFDVFEGCDEEFVFCCLGEGCTSVAALIWVVYYQPHFAHDEAGHGCCDPA